MAVTREQFLSRLQQMMEASVKTLERMEKSDKTMKDYILASEETRRGGGGDGGGGAGKGGGKSGRGEGLGGKTFDMFKVFTGGEAEWHEWSTDLTVLVATRSLTMREVMKKVKDMGKTEKEVMTCAEVMTEMAMSDDGFEDEDKWEELKGVEKMSRELYMWLRLRTEGEAKLVVGNLDPPKSVYGMKKATCNVQPEDDVEVAVHVPQGGEWT